MKSLETLIKEVDALFPTSPDCEGILSYNYTLGRFPCGWKFSVTNNWYNWSDKRLEHQFGVYKKPEYALQAFLNYVKENNIDVMALTHEGSKDE